MVKIKRYNYGVMTLLLLLLIYLIFVSLGLPDSMLGSSFPAIAENLSISSDQAGYIGLVVSAGTIISSIFSEKLISKLGTWAVVSVSILLTAAGLLSFSQVRAGYEWCFYLCAIPLGLGAGAIDSALNNYVAIHYKAIHMNWLHCSWGIGTSVSPLIISAFINPDKQSSGWDKGVLVIACIQLGIALLSFVSYPLWGKKKENAKTEEEYESVEKKPLYRNPVFYLGVIGFFCYCGLETTTGLWSGNFFYHTWNVDSSKAAAYTSLFYIGITIGRFLSGPLSLKIRQKNMIRIGESILITGLILMILPFNIWCSIIGVTMCGLGCAPIYPAIVGLTPYRFSRKLSQKAMGMQMAIAYCGNLSLSPLFGLVAKSLGEKYFLLPYVVLFFAILMVVVHEISNGMLDKRDKTLTDIEKKEYLTL